jgi:hypothetical protein
MKRSQVVVFEASPGIHLVSCIATDRQLRGSFFRMRYRCGLRSAFSVGILDSFKRNDFRIGDLQREPHCVIAEGRADVGQLKFQALHTSSAKQGV